LELIYPMFAMVILTAVVGVLTAFLRIRSSITGEVDPRYYKLLSGFAVTETVEKFGRNFSNLFEVPVLFYAACITALALKIDNQTLLVLAWIFVALRVIHTLIHISYNNVLHRFLPFFLSFLCAVGMWVVVVMSVP
jgi:hypothetical protein